MRKITKSIVSVFIIILLCGVSFTTSYYWLEIYPRRKQLDLWASNYDLNDENSKVLIELLEYHYSYDLDWLSTDVGAALVDNRESFRSYWHLIGLHWYLWIKIVYVPEERKSIWLSRIYAQGKYGAYDAARIYFNKSLEDLECNEVVYLSGFAVKPSQASKDQNVIIKALEDEGIVGDICKG